MTDMTHASFDSFLVEDVILTLGTLRGSLDWIAEGGDKGRVGVERLDRQLALLEDRARALRSGRSPDRETEALEEGSDGGTLPVFRSRRS